MISRENNFNLIRILAAFGVLVAHCFPLSATNPARIFLGEAIGIHLGEWAVNVFFAISGFLVTQSYLRAPRLGRFVRARAYRLVPALAVNTAFCALLLGAFFTTLPLADYFSNKEVYRFILNNSLFLHTEYELPGVFATLPYPEAVNGSLWSLRYEFKMYVVLALLAALGCLRKPSFFMAAAILYGVIWSVLTWLPHSIPDAAHYAIMKRVSLYFALGVCLQYFRERVVFSWTYFLLLCGLYYLTRGRPIADLTSALAVTYGVFCCAFLIKGVLLRYNKFSDISYGFYLYAFPVQQSLSALVPGIGFWQMLVPATVVTGLLAWLSWNYIEAPALKRLKNAK